MKYIFYNFYIKNYKFYLKVRNFFKKFDIILNEKIINFHKYILCKTYTYLKLFIKILQDLIKKSLTFIYLKNKLIYEGSYSHILSYLIIIKSVQI